jgi:uncharacterized Rmd1/YagE family protein
MAQNMRDLEPTLGAIVDQADQLAQSLTVHQSVREQRETIVEWAIIILILASIALGLAAPDQLNPWFR